MRLPRNIGTEEQNQCHEKCIIIIFALRWADSTLRRSEDACSDRYNHSQLSCNYTVDNEQMHSHVKQRLHAGGKIRDRCNMACWQRSKTETAHYRGQLKTAGHKEDLGHMQAKHCMQ